MVLAEYERRGYNTVVVPLLQDGATPFRTTTDGYVKGRRCPGRRALALLAESSFAVWLHVDIFSAGAAGSTYLGPLANSNREWLMKGSDGHYKISSVADRPGLFCWTALGFRRFLGNLLVDLIDAYPIDGILFDVRCYPHANENPETWSHLGVTCLRRIREELGIELVHFLADPTEEEFKAVFDWREAQFEVFLENLKARVQKSRHHILTAALASLSPPPPKSPPWATCYGKGTIEEVAILATAAGMTEAIVELDSLISDRRPAIAAVECEAQLAALGDVLNTLPLHGFLVLEPNFDAEPAIPKASFTWERTGTPEMHPIDVAERILKRLISQIDPADPLSLFFTELDEYFMAESEDIRFRHVARLRQSVQMIRKMIAEESPTSSERRGEILRELDLVARILLLAPAPPIEY